MSTAPVLNFPALDQAIAQFEGQYVPGSLAQQNNNPGNINGGSGAGGFVSYPSLASGLSAEDSLISQYADQGVTLGELLSKWSQTNSESGYQQGVSNIMGGSPLDTPVSAFQGTSSTASDSLLAQAGLPSSGAVSSGALTTGSPAVDPSSLLNTLGPLGSLYGLVTGNYPGGAASGAGATNWGRLAAGLVGLLLIGGGIFMFKDGNTNVVVQLRQAARHVGATAAEAA